MTASRHALVLGVVACAGLLCAVERAASALPPGRVSHGPTIKVLLLDDLERLTVRALDGSTLGLQVGEEISQLSGEEELRFRGDAATVAGREVSGARFWIWGETAAEGERLTRVEDRVYEGVLELNPPRRPGGRWILVNRLPLERYLLGVVPGEMDPWAPPGKKPKFPDDALRVQTVAARTYALYQILARGTGARYHVTADSRSQVYKGYNLHPRVVDAVASTRGVVLTYEGKLFESFYHSTCGGATADASAVFGGVSLAPLAPTRCGYCKQSKHFQWESEISEREIRAALARFLDEHQVQIGRLAAIEPLDRGPGGHASYVRIRHAKGSFELDATVFRELLLAEGESGVRSTSFECRAEPDGAQFHFAGRGWGHGVGMCQWGAKGLADEGAGWRDILAHYYPRSVLTPLW